jgi:hypothetical protein
LTGQNPEILTSTSNARDASQFITEKSLCRNREELVQSLAILQEALAAGRALAGRPSEAIPTATVNDRVPIPEDVVVQEYVSGWDHSVVVIEVGDCPVALAPERYVYPKGFTPYVDYLTFEVKFHPETHVELLRYQDDPTLYPSSRSSQSRPSTPTRWPARPGAMSTSVCRRRDRVSPSSSKSTQCLPSFSLGTTSGRMLPSVKASPGDIAR